MNKTIAWTALIGLTAVLLATSACSPYLLSDQGNAFLKGFVTHELVSLLGVIVAITLTATASIHFELNKLEAASGAPFTRTRRAIRMSAYSLIILFALGGILVIVKPMLGSDPRATAAANALAISIVVFNLFVLVDLAQTTFGIPAKVPVRENAKDVSA